MITLFINCKNIGDDTIVMGLEVTLQRDQSPAGTLIESAANTGSRPIIAISDQVGYQYQKNNAIADQVWNQYKRFGFSIDIYIFWPFLVDFHRNYQSPQPSIYRASQTGQSSCQNSIKIKISTFIVSPFDRAGAVQKQLSDRDRQRSQQRLLSLLFHSRRINRAQYVVPSLYLIQCDRGIRSSGGRQTQTSFFICLHG